MKSYKQFLKEDAKVESPNEVDKAKERFEKKKEDFEGQKERELAQARERDFKNKEAERKEDLRKKQLEKKQEN